MLWTGDKVEGVLEPGSLPNVSLSGNERGWYYNQGLYQMYSEWGEGGGGLDVLNG